MFILFFVLFLLFLFYHFYYKRRNLPPGPVPIPLLGNLGSLAGERPRYDVFIHWRKKYGDVFTFWLSEFPMVMVCDYKVIHDAFVKDYSDELAGKFTLEALMKRIRGGINGIIEPSGELWKEQRRFSLQVLRNFGVGRNLMEEKILDEVVCMIKRLEEDQKSGICNIISRFDLCVGSIINNLIFGYRFDGPTEGEFLKLKTLMTDLFIHINTPTNLIVGLFYWLRHIPPFYNAAEKSAYLTQKIFDNLDEQIKDHERKCDLTAESEPLDFCEAYLREMERQKNSDSSKKEFYTRNQLRNICMDLWAAGLETTSTTCQFAVIYALNHPDVYNKLQKELDTVVQGDKLVTLNDKLNLPYFNAFINEVQRTLNLILINLFHQALDDIVIGGYKIKKGTIVIPQIANVMYDEKIFPDPFTFKPERFIDSSGNLKKVEQLTPFSIGKRQCLGESLARMELFLILSNLFKHFDLKPEGELPPSMLKKWALTVQPEPYKIRVYKRT